MHDATRRLIEHRLGSLADLKRRYIQEQETHQSQVQRLSEQMDDIDDQATELQQLLIEAQRQDNPKECSE